MLLEAFALLRARRSAKLIILGEGPERAQLEGRVLELGIEGDVDLPGFLQNPYAIMRHAALFVMSSRYEGLPTVLIEAMACGCPVVSTNCPSGPSEILDQGQFGPLVPVGDVEALANAMMETLDDPLPPDVLKSRASIFHIDNVLDSYRRILLV
jgi:glycosyltransferase involved in cell wall biosynthesis